VFQKLPNALLHDEYLRLLNVGSECVPVLQHIFDDWPTLDQLSWYS
jgi:hypothetical protein